MEEPRRHFALDSIYSNRELDTIYQHKQQELLELDLALGMAGLPARIFGNGFLKASGDFFERSLYNVIKGIGFTAQALIHSRNSAHIIERINNKFFTTDHGKLAEIEHLSQIANLFPGKENPNETPEEEKARKSKWPRSVVITTNSSLTSPALFADKLNNAAHVADLANSTNHSGTASAIGEAERGGKNVVISFYSSKRNVFENIEANVRRYHQIRAENGTNLVGIDKSSEMLAQALIYLTSYRKPDGSLDTHNPSSAKSNSAIDTRNSRPVLRNDAEEILDRVVFYGFSAAATRTHDTARIYRGTLENGMVFRKTENGFAKTNDSDSAIVQKIRIVTAGGPNLTFKSQGIYEPQVKAFISQNDVGALFAGGLLFKDQSAILVSTDKHNLQGHAESSYLRAIQEHFTSQGNSR